MKKGFLAVLFVFLFAAIIVYAAAPKSQVSLNFNPRLVLYISAFVLLGVLLGAISGKLHFTGVPGKKLPDKGEFCLCCIHELKDRVLLYLVDANSNRERVYEIGKNQLLDKEGEEFTDFKNFPRKFIAMRRTINPEGESGPASKDRDVYYCIPMNV